MLLLVITIYRWEIYGICRKPENAPAKETLKAMFHHRYPDIRNSGYPVAQLLRFTRDMQPGDVVIIPSSGAVHVAMGVVTGDM